MNIFTGGKADWLSLPETKRNELKNSCLWSNRNGCWISRAKAGNTYFLAQLLAELGFENQGTEGERLSFAEQIEVKQERAAERADRYEDRADKAEESSTALYNRAHSMADCIPLGQPILVGHYSEGRDRRFRDRISKTFERGFEEGDKAKYYERRAVCARASADGSQYSDPRYLGNRIKETKAEIAVLENRLQGKFYHYSTPEPIADDYRNRLTVLLDEQHEKLEFYEHCLATCGREVFTKETLKGKQAVKIRGRWEPIVKLNPSTVAVPNICFPLPEDQRKYAMKYAYTEVQEAR
ncbi:MAG TPA: DUF3560 domain-containing protein [Verrucomicrobiae bacterium]|nr:DUF3560 domain-containing protein [Verrucomicrobiae bacterium]